MVGGRKCREKGRKWRMYNGREGIGEERIAGVVKGRESR